LAEKFETEVEYEIRLPLQHGTLNLKIKVPPKTLSLEEIKQLIKRLIQDDLTSKVTSEGEHQKQ